jgi:integrase
MIYTRGSRWWIRYSVDGHQYRESVAKATGENTAAAARKLYKQRLGELTSGTFVGPDERRVRLADLRALLESDYRLHARKSGDRADRAWKHLKRHFPHDPRAIQLTTDRLHRYVEARTAEEAQPATIRNELSVLRRAFRVAVERQRLRAPAMPTFPSIRVDNARDVFYTDDEVAAVRKELPEPLKHLWTVAAWTGWRRNELFRLQWSQVDFDAGVIRLNVGTTKNREGREVPFDVVPDLVAALEAQRAYTLKVQRRLGGIVSHVFHRNGKPIKRMDVARQSACKRAKVLGPDGRPKVLHDLRRTAARNLTRAGVPRHVAMRILGLKTESMFRRYSIVETDDLRDGMAKVLAFRSRERRQETGT